MRLAGPQKADNSSKSGLCLRRLDVKPIKKRGTSKESTQGQSSKRQSCRMSGVAREQASSVSLGGTRRLGPLGAHVSTYGKQ